MGTRCSSSTTTRPSATSCAATWSRPASRSRSPPTGQAALAAYAAERARPGRARPDAARHRRAGGVPAAARAAPGSCPIIMLTALGEEADRVARAGARRRRLRDQAVLAARAGAAGAVGAAPRRARRTGRRPAVLRDGDLRRRRRPPGRPAAAARELALTVREFDLLDFLMRHPGRAFAPGRAAGGGVGLDLRRPVHRHRPRATAAGEDRGRPGRTRSASSPSGASATGTSRTRRCVTSC